MSEMTDDQLLLSISGSKSKEARELVGRITRGGCTRGPMTGRSGKELKS